MKNKIFKEITREEINNEILEAHLKTMSKTEINELNKDVLLEIAEIEIEIDSIERLKVINTKDYTTLINKRIDLEGLKLKIKST